MDRVRRATAISTLPAPPAGGTPGFFTPGNPGLGQPATVPGYEWFNAVQEELIALITRGGQTPANNDLVQVRRSLDRLFAGNMTNLFGDTTLTVDNAGLVFVDASVSPRIITLPAANALGGMPIQFRIQKADGSANSVSINRAGADLIEGASSVVLIAQHHSVTLVSNGLDRWAVLSGGGASSTRPGVARFATAAETDLGTLANVAVTPAALGVATRLFAANGYLRIPGGGLIQWGTAITTATPPTTFNFPVAFPNACLRVLGVCEGNGASPIGVEIISTTQFRAWGRDVTLTNAPYAARAFAYLAIGN